MTPSSQQEAQEAVIGYLKKTLQALPTGTVLDATRYSGGTSVAPCDDTEAHNLPSDFTTIGDLKLPPDIDPAAAVADAGQAWVSWGWHVVERDGFTKPNRFGYGTDGYRLQITAAPKPGYPPTLEAISPCFPADTANNRTPFPPLLRAD